MSLTMLISNGAELSSDVAMASTDKVLCRAGYVYVGSTKANSTDGVATTGNAVNLYPGDCGGRGGPPSFDDMILLIVIFIAHFCKLVPVGLQGASCFLLFHSQFLSSTTVPGGGTRSTFGHDLAPISIPSTDVSRCQGQAL